MKPRALLAALICFATASVADEPPLTAPPAARPRQAMPAAIPPESSDVPNERTLSSAAPSPQFKSEGKWLLAGYNNNEVVYTIIVTNLDKSIIRCTTLIQGSYFEDGKKLSIADRQITTLMPNQPTKVGNWMDLDEPSGVTYSVTCHAV